MEFTETQTVVYETESIEVEKGINMFSENTYTENYAGDESYLIDIKGGLRVAFVSETFTNNGNIFKEAFEAFLPEVQFNLDFLQNDFSSDSQPQARVKQMFIRI